MAAEFAERVAKTFRENVDSVCELAHFDRFILEIAIDGLEKVADSLLNEHRLYNASRIPHNRALALRNIHRNESLRRHYQAMFNQCIVLLVSYFGSAVHDLFRGAITYALVHGIDVQATREEIKVAWRDLSAGPDSASQFADILVTQKDISFQDMQSIGRAFSTHFGVTIERTAIVNDIVLGQAARHAIVHSGGIVEQRMIKQITSATPRLLKPTIAVDSSISFDRDEIKMLGESMVQYVKTLTEKVCARLDTP